MARPDVYDLGRWVNIPRALALAIDQDRAERDGGKFPLFLDSRTARILGKDKQPFGARIDATLSFKS